MYKALARIPLRFSSMGQYAPIHSKFLIVGAGDGGVSTATLLKSYSTNSVRDITLIDPKSEYIYQSGQTMVGSGLKSLKDIMISSGKRIPSGISHVKKNVTSVKPEINTVTCSDGTQYSYDYLVLSVGIHPKLELIKGLREALDDPTVPVATNYIPEYATKMNNLKNSFKGGKALFTMPSTPIKCAGAPLKVTFLSANYWRNHKVNASLKYYTGTPKIFSNPFYLTALEDVARSYNIDFTTRRELIEIKPDTRTAIFKDLDSNTTFEESFDLMHATPIMRAPEFLADSKLTNQNGFVNVDINTLQHKIYKNIFALGDCADLPTSKTLSAVNDQFPVVANNIMDAIKGKELSHKYYGYTACPVFVGDDKVMLCEFGYNNRIMPTFFKDQRKPSKFFYLLKSQVFNRLALYNLCWMVRPIRIFLSKFPYNKHWDYKA